MKKNLSLSNIFDELLLESHGIAVEIRKTYPLLVDAICDEVLREEKPCNKHDFYISDNIIDKYFSIKTGEYFCIYQPQISIKLNCVENQKAFNFAPVKGNFALIGTFKSNVLEGSRFSFEFPYYKNINRHELKEKINDVVIHELKHAYQYGLTVSGIGKFEVGKIDNIIFDLYKYINEYSTDDAIKQIIHYYYVTTSLETNAFVAQLWGQLLKYNIKNVTDLKRHLKQTEIWNLLVKMEQFTVGDVWERMKEYYKKDDQQLSDYLNIEFLKYAIKFDKIVTKYYGNKKIRFKIFEYDGDPKKTLLNIKRMNWFIGKTKNKFFKVAEEFLNNVLDGEIKEYLNPPKSFGPCYPIPKLFVI